MTVEQQIAAIGGVVKELAQQQREMQLEMYTRQPQPEQPSREDPPKKEYDTSTNEGFGLYMKDLMREVVQENEKTRELREKAKQEARNRAEFLQRHSELRPGDLDKIGAFLSDPRNITMEDAYSIYKAKTAGDGASGQINDLLGSLMRTADHPA